jgi:hypothetical protein
VLYAVDPVCTGSLEFALLLPVGAANVAVVPPINVMVGVPEVALMLAAVVLALKSH